MPDALRFVLSLLAGVVLGLIYYGGLWLTVSRLPKTPHPAGLAMASFVGRMAVLLAGIYVVMGTRWEFALACLVGVLVARTVLVRRIQPHNAPPPVSPE
jgi:F1F0 ATPase subunit 2